MEGEYIGEEEFGAVKGVAGGNFFIMGENQMAALMAAQAAVDAISGVPGVITPFPGGIVASGSKVGSKKYKFMGASTNEAYCPTLKDKVEDSKVPEASRRSTRSSSTASMRMRSGPRWLRVSGPQPRCRA